MPLKAIQTLYAGCRFRSRLEARWAVFFDAMDIRWEYEPQGFMIGPEGEEHSYLPDFWLPGLKQWVEVKGAVLPVEERLKIVHAVIPHWGLPDGDNGVLLLGGIPNVNAGLIAWHWNYTFYKGDFYRTGYLWPSGTERIPLEWCLACGVDGGSWDLDWPGMENIFSRGSSAWNPSASLWERWTWTGSNQVQPSDLQVIDAYVAARSARFEHGETPVIAR